MIVIKLWCHFKAFIQYIFYKLIYGKRLSIGKNVTWRRGLALMISKNGKVEIGNNCFFNNDCSIFSNQQVKIGYDVLFGENIKIYDHNHRFSEEQLIKNQGFSNGSVLIGNHCWIGSNVCILKNSKIGDNCVIGAGCVITGKIPDGTVVSVDDQLQVHRKVLKEKKN